MTCPVYTNIDQLRADNDKAAVDAAVGVGEAVDVAQLVEYTYLELARRGELARYTEVVRAETHVEGSSPIKPNDLNPYGEGWAKPATPVDSDPYGEGWAKPATPVDSDPYGADFARPVITDPYGDQWAVGATPGGTTYIEPYIPPRGAYEAREIADATRDLYPISNVPSVPGEPRPDIRESGRPRRRR